MNSLFLIPRPAFRPLRCLEELLIHLATDLPSLTMNEFYNGLFESKLPMIVRTPTRMEELEKQAREYGAISPGHLEFAVAPDGVLYTFSALERELDGKGLELEIQRLHSKKHLLANCFRYFVGRRPAN